MKKIDNPTHAINILRDWYERCHAGCDDPECLGAKAWDQGLDILAIDWLAKNTLEEDMDTLEDEAWQFMYDKNGYTWSKMVDNQWDQFEDVK